MKLTFYIRIALLTVIMIVGATALMMGLFMFLSGKEHEFMIGIYCIISGILSGAGALIGIIRYNRKYQEILLNALLQNPDKLKFSFQDVQSQQSILIGDDVLFIEKSYYPFHEFYIRLLEVSLKENELTFLFEKQVRKARVNHLLKIYPPLDILPEIKTWITEQTSRSGER